MQVEMKMPDLSTADSVIRVVEWRVAPGQAVQQGQVLLEVETDKATMEVEAYLSGVIRQLVAEPDTEVETGQTICVIETGQAQPQAKAGGMFAKRRQQAALEKDRTTPPAPGLSANQRTVAQRMTQSKQTVPHFYVQTSANAGPMVARRQAAPADKPVWDAFFVWAVGQALADFERFRLSFRDGQLVPRETDAVGVAVDVEGELYVVPVEHPAAKSPEQISSEIRAQVQDLRDGSAEARKLRPGTITVSNLGSTCVESFTAIINPPEAAILAIGKVAEVPAVVAGKLAIEARVSLTLSVDHRVAGGKLAGQFLGAIVRHLEALGSGQ